MAEKKERKGKKVRKGRKHEKTQMHAYYEVKGNELVRKKKSCPRCGPGTLLANHKGRVYCGKCGYTEFEKRGGDQAFQPPAQKPEAKPEKPAEQSKPSEEPKPTEQQKPAEPARETEEKPQG